MGTGLGCKELESTSRVVLQKGKADHYNSGLSDMITRFLTEVRISFNPFNLRSKSARLFLSLIPPTARTDGMKIESKMLPRASKEPASLGVKFSMYKSPLVNKKWQPICGWQFEHDIAPNSS